MLQYFDSQDTEIEELENKRAERLQDLDLQLGLQRQAREAQEAEQRAQAMHRDMFENRLELSWTRAVRLCVGLPIEFVDSYWPLILSPGDDLAPLETRLTTTAEVPFYVGGTVNVLRRWLGDHGWTATLAGRQEPGKRLMQGHVDSYSSMRVIGIVEGKHSKTVETHLIKYALDQFPATCLNKAPDSRGLTDDINFIYVCLSQ